MLKIRLQRVGKKHEPVFRVVVCDSKRGPKSGDNIEVLGSYDARDKNDTKVNGDRVKYWISKGAQVSDTVNNLLINLKIIDGKKINVLPKKSPIIKEEEKPEEVSEDKKEDVENKTESNGEESEEVETKEENKEQEVVEKKDNVDDSKKEEIKQGALEEDK